MPDIVERVGGDGIRTQKFTDQGDGSYAQVVSAMGSARDVVEITPDDNTVLSDIVGLYVGTGGNVAIKGESGVAVTLVGVPTGTILPIRAKNVMATNTTATDIVGFVL